MKLRRLIFITHLYIGFAAGFFLVLSGLTGSLLVFREEIEALSHQELMEAEPGGERASLQAILDRVRCAYPHEELLSVRMPRTAEQTYLLKMSGSHDLFVYVDPYSGKLLGAHRQEETFMGWIALLHTQLLIGERGKTVLGVSALLLVCMSITGIMLWWPLNGKWSRGFKFDWQAPWKRLLFDTHRATGIYVSLFLLIIGFTGLSLVFNQSVAELVNFLTASPSRTAPPRLHPPSAAGSPMPIDDLLLQADHILPAPTTWINFPQTPQAPLVVRKKMPEELHPNGRSFIFFNPYTGEVLRAENGATAPVGTRIYNSFYPIHIGISGGMTTRVLQVLIGFSPLVLLATGYLMWRNRQRARHKT